MQGPTAQKERIHDALDGAIGVLENRVAGLASFVDSLVNAPGPTGATAHTQKPESYFAQVLQEAAPRIRACTSELNTQIDRLHEILGC